MKRTRLETLDNQIIHGHYDLNQDQYLDDQIIINNKLVLKKPKKSISPTKTPNERPSKKPKIDEILDDDEDLSDPDSFFRLLFLGPHNTPLNPSEQSKTDIVLKTTTNNMCNNPLCDHLDYDNNPEKIIVPTFEIIKDINDLIELGKSYHCKKNKEYKGMNLRLLCNLLAPLTELRNMVGMHKVKHQMVNQILFFLQGYNKAQKCNKCHDCTFNLPCTKNNDEMLHTVVTGPPGVGKTELGKILGKVYKEMGILETGHFKLVTRSDLIAEYLGQTAIKTQKVINSCKGGVMFIDEAYSLGNPEGRDSFSKECLDTLNHNLSEKRDFLCIIAGYKDALESSFFKYNEGLRRRFTFRYEIDEYTSEELLQIFELKVRLGNWLMPYDKKKIEVEPVLIEEKPKEPIVVVDELDEAQPVEMTKEESSKTNLFDKLPEEDKTPEQLIKEELERQVFQQLKDSVKAFFSTHHKSFPNYGGDIETLVLQCKIAHSRSSFSAEENEHKRLSIKNIKDGFDSFLTNRKVSKSIKNAISMYGA